jgi:hypothetical protein
MALHRLETIGVEATMTQFLSRLIRTHLKSSNDIRDARPVHKDRPREERFSVIYVILGEEAMKKMKKIRVE